MMLSSLTVLLASCGGGGGTATPAGPSLSIVAQDLTASTGAGASGFKMFNAISNITGDPGSRLDSLMVQVDSFDLLKDDGTTWVSVYSGGDFLETIGAAGQTTANTLVGTLPPAGNYIAYRFTVSSLKMNLVLVTGGTTTWYTTTQSLTSGETWSFSNNAADYGVVTYTPPAAFVHTTYFPQALAVTGSDSVVLYYLMERNGIVECDGTTPNSDITYCTTDQTVDMVLPAKPATMMRTIVSASSGSVLPALRTNIITAFYGGQDQLLGAYCQRPADWYFNGSSLTTGSGLYSSASGTGSLDLNFMDGDGIADGTYNVTMDFSCSASTYSNLVIAPTGTGTNVYDTDYVLAASGNATCTALP